jgi:hypothetical protein
MKTPPSPTHEAMNYYTFYVPIYFYLHLEFSLNVHSSWASSPINKPSWLFKPPHDPLFLPMCSLFNSVSARLSTFYLPLSLLMFVNLHKTSRSFKCSCPRALSYYHQSPPSTMTRPLSNLPLSSYVAPYPTDMSVTKNVTTQTQNLL